MGDWREHESEIPGKTVSVAYDNQRNACDCFRSPATVLLVVGTARRCGLVLSVCDRLDGYDDGMLETGAV